MFTVITTIKLIIYKNKYDLILPRNKKIVFDIFYKCIFSLYYLIYFISLFY